MTRKKEDDAPEPMDPSIRENVVGTPHVANERTAYSLVELVAEVRALFPETSYEFDNRNGRGVALAVMFDIDESNAPLGEVLPLVAGDYRVALVDTADSVVCVTVNNSARSMDDRTAWGLQDAYDVLYDGDESYTDEESW